MYSSNDLSFVISSKRMSYFFKIEIHSFKIHLKDSCHSFTHGFVSPGRPMDGKKNTIDFAIFNFSVVDG